MRSFEPLPRSTQHVAVREIVDVELDDLRHPRARGVQQLEQRAVAQADQLGGFEFTGLRAGGISSRSTWSIVSAFGRRRGGLRAAAAVRSGRRSRCLPVPGNGEARAPMTAGGRGSMPRAEARADARSADERGRRRAGVTSAESRDAAGREPVDIAAEVAPIRRDRVLATARARSRRAAGTRPPPDRAARQCPESAQSFALRPARRPPGCRCACAPSAQPVTASCSGTHSTRMSASSASRA